MVVLEDPIKWREVGRTYSALRERRDGITPQVRGQRFNSLIADLFTSFGIPAKANQKSVGEIDVTFSHGGRRFILEAKWERGRTSTDPIAKLQRRVEQRMVGVSGVFLSMKGYTADALAEVDKGRRLDMLLLDQDHWEAMLSGFVPPAEMLELVTDAASFRGQAYTPLLSLLTSQASVPVVDFAALSGTSGDLLRVPADHVRADIVVDGLESRALGVATTGSDDVLITTDQGLLRVDPARRELDWAVPISGCHGNPVLRGDSIIVQRAHGLCRYHGGELKAVSAGESTSRSGHLLTRPDGSTWCFDPGFEGDDRRSPTSLIELGERVGDERTTELTRRPGIAVGAAWLNEADVVVAGSETFVLSTAGAVERELTLPSPLPGALVAVDERHVLLFGRDATLWVADVVTGRRAAIGVADAVEVLAARLALGAEGSLHLAMKYRRRGGTSRTAVLHISASGPWLPPLEPDPMREPDLSGEPEPDPVPEPPQAGAGHDPGEPPAVVPAQERATAGVPDVPVPDVTRMRLADRQQGNQDGIALAEVLPLFALEGAASVNFDVVRWLYPWREQWRLIATNQAPPQVTLAEWLPVAARYLGAYAAPAELVDAHFAPPPAYTAGFGDGVRAVWDNAIQRGTVPRDPRALHDWLREPVIRRRVGRVDLRGSMTLKEARTDSAKRGAVSTSKWIGRVVLWLATFVFGIGTIAAIDITRTGGWPNQGTAYAVSGILFFSLPFAGLLFATVVDIRRRRRRKREGSR